MYKDADPITIKKERDDRNRAMIISKITYFRWVTYILLVISFFILNTENLFNYFSIVTSYSNQIHFFN